MYKQLWNNLTEDFSNDCQVNSDEKTHVTEEKLTVKLKVVFGNLKEQIKRVGGTCSSNDLKENKEAINVTEQVEVGVRQNANEGKEVSDVNEKPAELVMDSIEPESKGSQYNSL